MGSLMNLPLVLIGLILAPIGLLGALGIAILVLKAVTIVGKASEPQTRDPDGDYRLDQSKEVGRDDPPPAG